MTLDASLRAALGRSPEARQALAEVEGYRGKQLQALGIGRPQVEVQTVVGPAPRARGNQVSSSDDQYSPDITGAFVRGTVSVIQPIFTWGLVENARIAAEHGVRAAQAGVDVKSTEVALRVKQAYWGAVAAKAIRAFLLEVRDQVDQAIARTERLVEGGYATDIDLYRFRSKRGELERFINLADRTLDLATQALGTWTGQPKGVAVEPTDETLPADMKPLPSVDLYVQNALAGRPEFSQLRDGIEARRRLVAVERKQGYPLFFVGLLGDLAYATNRDRLENPYVIDPLYHTAVGPVIGF
jgi:outer membrane protein TolC